MPAGAGRPSGSYQQVTIPALTPPCISLVRESPTIIVRALSTGAMAAKTWSKKLTSGFSTPSRSERNTPSISAPRPDRRSFFSWAITVPLDTAYCRTRPRREATIWKLSSRKTMVSPRQVWYFSLNSAARAGSMPAEAKKSRKRPTRISGFVSSLRSRRSQ